MKIPYFYLIFVMILIAFSFVYNLVNKTNLNLSSDNNRPKIGFFLIGTGLYINLVEQLIESMEKYFCVNNKAFVHYFIFTDNTIWTPYLTNKQRSFTIINQEKLSWPNSTLLRFQIILNKNKQLGYESYDYLYWLDADMRLMDFICEDILGDLVATSHSHYPSSQSAYPYDSNVKSTAYVEPSKRFEHPYYVGAFFGGNSFEMIKLLNTCQQNIQKDFNSLNGYIAHVHDESHLNR